MREGYGSGSIFPIFFLVNKIPRLLDFGILGGVREGQDAAAACFYISFIVMVMIMVVVVCYVNHFPLSSVVSF